jgi:hypothetical protein
MAGAASNRTAKIAISFFIVSILLNELKNPFWFSLIISCLPPDSPLPPFPERVTPDLISGKPNNPKPFPASN